MNDRAHLPDPAASASAAASHPDAALPVGMRLGAFEIQRVLSRSASSVVYAASDLALAMPVALQEYLPDRLVRRDAGLRLVAAAEWHEAPIARGLNAFVEDARLLSRCEHPSLVRVHQLFHSHGTAYRVMPLYAGQRLADLLREMASTPDEASLRALLDGLLGALETIHRTGRAHGGVSIDNILLLADDQPMLLGPGSAAREIGSDLVESLMATLESPAVNGAFPAQAGTAPTGAALDLYQLAEVLRFCIAGEPSSPPGALRLREPLARVIARGLPSEARPPYSAALLSALDAAVSPFAEDRPLSVAQFRDWLARGVPAVPGRGQVRTPSPADAAPAEATARAVPAPPPPLATDPASRRSPKAAAAGASQTEPSFSRDAGHDATEPFAPWPDVVRAIDPPFAAAPEPAPALLPLQHAARARRRRYQWMMAAVLALLAAGVLAIATGAWNLAPEIALEPNVGRLDTLPAPPVTVGRDTPPVVAAAPAAPASPPAAEPRDPARPVASPVATEPSAVGPATWVPSPTAAPTAAAPERAAPPAAPVPSDALAQAAPGAQPDPIAQAAPVAQRNPMTQAAPVTRPDAVARATAAAPPPRPAPRERTVRAVAAAPVPTPRAACAGRSEFALYRCMQQQCEATRFFAHPQCVRLRRDDRVD